MDKTNTAAELKKQADASARAIRAGAADENALSMPAQSGSAKAAYDARDKEKAKRKEVEAKLAAEKERREKAEAERDAEKERREKAEAERDAEKERREKAEAALAPNSWKLRPLVNVRPAMKMKYYPGGF